MIVRNGHDAGLKVLRHNAAFDAACAAIPGLAAWTDPARAEPVTDVLPGGSLLNHYRGQRRATASRCCPGWSSSATRSAPRPRTSVAGITLALMQAERLLADVDQQAPTSTRSGTPSTPGAAR